MTDIINQIAELSAQGHGDRHIARELGITRHAARAGLLEIAKHPKHGEIIAPYPSADAPASAWAERIAITWRRSAESIIETGRLLIAAKAALEHGEWLKVTEQLPFPERTAQRLMELGRDQRLVNPSILPLLPDRWTRIHTLHKLDDETFERRIHALAPVNGARAVMASRVHSGDLDFSPTPPWATRALAETVLPHLLGRPFDLRAYTAWEPACGEGHMAEVLREYFGEVEATDIHDYGYGGKNDFLESYSPLMCGWRPDWIITNPPFKEKAEQFALRALDLAGVGVAIFAQLRWLETIGRYERLFRDQPPTLISFFCERVALHMGEWKPDGGTATAYIWLVWLKDRLPQPPFWIPPGQQEALTRPDDIERFTAHPVIKKNRQHDAAKPLWVAPSEPAPHPVAPDAPGAGSHLSGAAE